MRIVRRTINCCCILTLCNVIFLWGVLTDGTALKIAGIVLLTVVFVLINFRPMKQKEFTGKLKTLGGGCELLVLAAVCAAVQTALYIYILSAKPIEPGLLAWLGSGAVCLILLGLLTANGLIRLFFTSGQMTAGVRLSLIALWWVPIVNLFVFYRVCRTACGEYKFRAMKLRRNSGRRARRVCATKYPILLVHGIFFRDWKFINYWGRIPAELEENGAVVYYGGQQSSASVESSAGELHARILEIIEKEGCEKVNIIAHSKGGLDSRYAISCLGMDRHVASLTTINTPHRGCRFARRALEGLPKGVVGGVSRGYDKIFSKLGDGKPDFFAGVSELTDEKCAELDGMTPNREGVLYQSVGSKMRSARSAVVPLKLSYNIVRASDGENDGLVAVSSMPWGTFTMLEPVGKRGISHGDVIDLTRKDIKGFDVCEFYVDMVRGLKELGL